MYLCRNSINVGIYTLKLYLNVTDTTVKPLVNSRYGDAKLGDEDSRKQKKFPVYLSSG